MLRNFEEVPLNISIIRVLKYVRGKRGGGVTVFRRKCKMFCLTKPKHFKDEPPYFSECWWYRKTLRLKGNYLDFIWKNTCLTFPRKVLREAFCASKYFWHRESLWIRSGGGGSVTAFRHFYCLTLSKNFVVEPSCVSDFFK